MLRNEPGIYYEDLYPLVCFLPRFSIHPPLQHEDDDSECILAKFEIFRIDIDIVARSASNVEGFRTRCRL